MWVSNDRVTCKQAVLWLIQLMFNAYELKNMLLCCIYSIVFGGKVHNWTQITHNFTKSNMLVVPQVKRGFKSNTFKTAPITSKRNKIKKQVCFEDNSIKCDRNKRQFTQNVLMWLQLGGTTILLDFIIRSFRFHLNHLFIFHFSTMNFYF